MKHLGTMKLPLSLLRIKGNQISSIKSIEYLSYFVLHELLYSAFFSLLTLYTSLDESISSGEDHNIGSTSSSDVAQKSFR